MICTYKFHTIWINLAINRHISAWNLQPHIDLGWFPWGVPKIGLPPLKNHPFIMFYIDINRVVHYKPSSYWGIPHLWKPPCYTFTFIIGFSAFSHLNHPATGGSPIHSPSFQGFVASSSAWKNCRARPRPTSRPHRSEGLFSEGKDPKHGETKKPSDIWITYVIWTIFMDYNYGLQYGL